MHFDVLIPVLHHDADIAFYGAVGSELARLGRKVAFVSLSKRGTARLRQDHEHVFYLYEGFNRKAVAAPEEIAKVERRYNLHNIANHVYSERVYYGGLQSEVEARAVYTFRFLERLLADHSIDMFVNNIGGEIIRRCIARIAAAGGPPNVVIDFAPFHGHVVATTDEVYWDELPKEPPALSPEDRISAEALVRDAINRKKMFTEPQKLGIDRGSFYRPLLNNVRTFLTEGDQIDYSLPFLYRERLKHVSRRLINHRFYERPAGEPFLFFPLHMPNDSAITIRAPQFTRQEGLVEYIAERALPTGHKLYVKPHPGAVDTFPISMLRRLSKIPNVRLIDPIVNAHELIADARAVIVINSTAGFEALFHLKPVVVLGRVYYRGYGVTTDVENLANLAEAVDRALHTPVDRERVLRFLWACRKIARPGVFGLKDETNIRRYAAVIVEKSARLRASSGNATPSQEDRAGMRVGP